MRRSLHTLKPEALQISLKIFSSEEKVDAQKLWRSLDVQASNLEVVKQLELQKQSNSSLEKLSFDPSQRSLWRTVRVRARSSLKDLCGEFSKPNPKKLTFDLSLQNWWRTVHIRKRSSLKDLYSGEEIKSKSFNPTRQSRWRSSFHLCKIKSPTLAEDLLFPQD